MIIRKQAQLRRLGARLKSGLAEIETKRAVGRTEWYYQVRDGFDLFHVPVELRKTWAKYLHREDGFVQLVEDRKDKKTSMGEVPSKLSTASVFFALLAAWAGILVIAVYALHSVFGFFR